MLDITNKNIFINNKKLKNKEYDHTILSFLPLYIETIDQRNARLNDYVLCLHHRLEKTPINVQ